MKKCDVMVKVDCLKKDKFEFEIESSIFDNDCEFEVKSMIENLIDSNEIENDKRYVIIGDFKQIELYDMDSGIEYETYIKVKEIFQIDEDIRKKYYLNKYNELILD